MNPIKVWFLRLSMAVLLAYQVPVLAKDSSKQLAMNLVYQRSLPSIVSITVRDHNGALRRGSGFFVSSKGLFITTFGVVENAHRITLRTEDGWLHPVDEVIALSKETNLALLRAPITKTRALEIIAADKQPKPGEAAIAIAGTQGLQWHISYGQIIAPDSEAKDGKNAALSFNTPLLAGNQGGPLVNQYGRVIGVLLPPATAEDKSLTQTAIPTKDVHALLDKINTLPLTATWTAKPPPPKKAVVLTQTPEATNQAEAEDEAALAAGLATAEKELATALKAEEATRKKQQATVKPKQKKSAKKQREPAQYLGQLKTLAWASLPTQRDPATICPPMISQHLDSEFRLITVSDRSRADGLLSLGGKLDTGKECNMWGCFDGYRLYMNFVISNREGKTLYREYFEVDEDDVNEACEELAEDIVDELEDILDP